MSVMAHHSAVLTDAGVRKPRSPSYKDAPFDAIVAEDNVLIHNPAKPTSASLPVSVVAVALRRSRGACVRCYVSRVGAVAGVLLRRGRRRERAISARHWP
jgi:hypothetical protein